MTRLLYSFDTSVWINGRRDLFPPDLFPTLWDKLEGTIMAGAIRSIDVVKDELGKKDDATTAWAAGQPDLFVTLEEDVQFATADVLAQHPKMMGRGGSRNAADPFVVGLALARHGVVVTQETRSRSLEKPRIPDVCLDLGVRCIPLVDVIRDQGWTF